MNATLTTKQAAEFLGVSRAWIKYISADGRLPYVATPYGRLYRRDVLEQFKERRLSALSRKAS